MNTTLFSKFRAQWERDEDGRAVLHDFLESASGVRLLSLLRESTQPVFLPVTSGEDPTVAAAHRHQRLIGFNLCLETLMSFAGAGPAAPEVSDLLEPWQHYGEAETN